MTEKNCERTFNVVGHDREYGLFLLLMAAILFTGCRTAQTPPPGALPIGPNAPFTQPRLSASSQQLAPQQFVPQQLAPQQLAAQRFASQRVAPSTSAVNQEIAQVGFVDRLRGGDRGCQSCQSGCGDCSPTDCNVTPFGYAMPPMGDTNRYGTDPQEFLCDGGDEPGFARVQRDGSVGGLDPQDTVVHYITDAGDTKIQPSNRVCVYAPRFGAVRQVTGAVAGEKTIGVNGFGQPVGPSATLLDVPSLTMIEDVELAHADVAKRVDAFRERNRGVPVENILQIELAEDVLQLMAAIDDLALDRMDQSQSAIIQQASLAAQTWMIRDAVEVMIESLQPPVLIRDAMPEGFTVYDFPDAGRIRIVKMADRAHAKQGEEVTFAIRVDNVGDSTVNEVVIEDNLVARLEYVQDSQSCDREATFETSRNDAGSLSLKWKLAEPLPVGEGAVIEFKCLVR